VWKAGSVSPDPRADAFSALARFQVTDATVGDTLQRMAEIAIEAVPRAEVAGLTMMGEDGSPATAIYTDVDSPEIDAAQYRDGEGPCLDAWRENRLVRLDHMDDFEDRYAGFVSACRDHGVESTLSAPLTNGSEAVGALNLYARVPKAFGEEDERLTEELASVCGSVLANVAAYWEAHDLSQQLDHAMQSRAVIEQAKGMLMARSPNLDADSAFEVLRRASQRENVKVRDIAQRIVERRLGEGEVGGEH
jgi:GAF domain-containing protein